MARRRVEKQRILDFAASIEEDIAQINDAFTLWQGSDYGNREVKMENLGVLTSPTPLSLFKKLSAEPATALRSLFGKDEIPEVIRLLFRYYVLGKKDEEGGKEREGKARGGDKLTGALRCRRRTPDDNLFTVALLKALCRRSMQWLRYLSYGASTADTFVAVAEALMEVACTCDPIPSELRAAAIEELAQVMAFGASRIVPPDDEMVEMRFEDEETEAVQRTLIRGLELLAGVGGAMTMRMADTCPCICSESAAVRDSLLHAIRTLSESKVAKAIGYIGNTSAEKAEREDIWGNWLLIAFNIALDTLEHPTFGNVVRVHAIQTLKAVLENGEKGAWNKAVSDPASPFASAAPVSSTSHTDISRLVVPRLVDLFVQSADNHSLTGFALGEIGDLLLRVSAKPFFVVRPSDADVLCNIANGCAPSSPYLLSTRRLAWSICKTMKTRLAQEDE